MVGDRRGTGSAATDLTPPARGVGPLLQRDYWAVLDDCELAPSEFGSFLAARFCELSPPELARFQRVDDTDRPLETGDELDVRIRLTGTFRVRVTHMSPNSLTFCTLRGHPEAGVITFGAYRNDRGQVIFHIRSHTRASTRRRYAGFLAIGEPMQTNTWIDFIDRLAHTVAKGVIGFVHEESCEIEEPGDRKDQPTFVAEGD